MSLPHQCLAKETQPGLLGDRGERQSKEKAESRGVGRPKGHMLAAQDKPPQEDGKSRVLSGTEGKSREVCWKSSGKRSPVLKGGT